MQDAAGAPLTGDADVDAPAPGRSEGRSRLLGTVLAVAVATFGADLASKVWALRSLTPGDPHPLIGEWIQLNLIRNSGAAFSIGDGMTWLMTLIATTITVVAIRVALRVRNLPWAVALGLLIGGSLGNLVDRFFREPGFLRGHVVDFIDYFGLFIGNVADIAIVVAAPIMAWLFLRGRLPDSPPRGAATGEDPQGSDDSDDTPTLRGEQ